MGGKWGEAKMGDFPPMTFMPRGDTASNPCGRFLYCLPLAKSSEGSDQLIQPPRRVESCHKYCVSFSLAAAPNLDWSLGRAFLAPLISA